MRKATLRLHLKETLLAYELESVIDVIDDTYTSLRWLELADAHRGPGAYGDSTFANDEFLRVRRVEIGTPNVLELLGLADTLLRTLTYLSAIGGIAGIGKSVHWVVDAGGKAIKARNDWLDGELKKVELTQKQDPQLQELARRKLFADAERAELEAAKLRRELELSAISLPEPIVDKAVRLYEAGKASPAVVDYKTRRQHDVRAKLPLIDDIVVDWELVPSGE